MLANGDRTVSRAGLASLLAVVAKSTYEAATGHVAFAALHLGDVASPVAICHAGGVLGGLLAFLSMNAARTSSNSKFGF